MLRLRCKFCKSPFFLKWGTAKRKKTNKQRYKCLYCKRIFVKGKDEREKISAKIGEAIIKLKNEGLSLRKIAKVLSIMNTPISHSTISRWIRDKEQ